MQRLASPGGFPQSGTSLRGPGLLGVAVAAMIVLAPRSARAQQLDVPVVVDHADELERVVRGDSLTVYLTGRVRVHRGDIRMRSRRAVLYGRSRIADMLDDVHVFDPTTELYADHVVFNETTNKLVATGNAQLVDRESGSQLLAEAITYDRDEGLITARPRPHMILVPRDTTGGERPFDVYADLVRFWSDSTRSELVGTGNVLIERDDLTAVGDSLHYDDRAGVVALRQEPEVETRAIYLTAEAIDLRLEEQEMDALVAIGSARTIDKGDTIPPAVPRAFRDVSETSFLEGDSLYVSFHGEAIDWVVAVGNARSLSYVRESPKGRVETWSVNYLLGHRLRLAFRGDTLAEVVATEGHRGVYRSADVRVGRARRLESEPIPWPDDAATGGRASPVARPRRGLRTVGSGGNG